MRVVKLCIALFVQLQVGYVTLRGLIIVTAKCQSLEVFESNYYHSHIIQSSP